MAEKTLHSLKVNATRLGQRLGENLAEHSRDLGLIDSFASGSGGSSGKYLENGAVVTATGVEETRRMLGSRREGDRTEGLKRVIAMMTKDLPVTTFFPLVTSLLSPSTPLSSRTLISLYIIHCAATAPELALLSINAYQKDLSDPNPIIRAGAIKTLSSMGLEDTRSLVGVAVSKGARDGAWYVRRASADAVSALWHADPTYDNRATLLPTLIVLLNTASPLTIGSALSAWEAMCPTRWDLVHPGYRKWCKMLVDVEEWGQCVLLRVLVRYGRTFFRDPRSGEVDPDLELLLRASEPLLQHMNPAVVSGVIKLQYYLAPPTRFVKLVRPLLRLLDSSPEVQAIVLEDCAIIAEERPDLLIDHIALFYVRFSEPIENKGVRLRILVALASETNVRALLNEFLIYVKDVDDTFSAEAIGAMGTCAQRVPAVAGDCLKALIKLTQGTNDVIIAQSVLVLRSLLRSNDFPSATASRATIITRLVVLLEAGKIKVPTARANIYWLIGQFAGDGLTETIAPDAVRLGAKGFSTESDPAKLQLLTLSAKALVLAHLSSSSTHLRTLSLLFTYMTTLARYDLTYEVRDRARFLKGLLASAGIGLTGEGEGARLTLSAEDFAKRVEVDDQGVVEVEERTMSSERVRRTLFEGKTGEATLESPRTGAELGTLSLALPGKRFAFNVALPPFPSTVPPSTIRDTYTPDALKSPPSFNQSYSPDSRSSTPLQGFGSDSRGSNGRGRASPVVLVPTSFAAGESEGMSSSFGGKKGFVDLEDFYASEPEQEMEGEEESEAEDDSGEESEEDEEDEEESEEDESEEEEDEGADDALLKQQ